MNHRSVNYSTDMNELWRLIGEREFKIAKMSDHISALVIRIEELEAENGRLATTNSADADGGRSGSPEGSILRCGEPVFERTDESNRREHKAPEEPNKVSRAWSGDMG